MVDSPMTVASSNLRVAYFASGAAGMFCGSCLRDNRIAATLMEQGRDVVLLPLYTPLRTDERDVSRAPVLYGGINVYLDQTSRLFRKFPRWLTGWLDSPFLLNLLSRWSCSVDAKSLGPMTVSVLKGEHGAQVVELEKLLDVLQELRPAVVQLPNLPFLGVARKIKERLGVPVFCTLSGEDIFLDELTEPHKSQAFALIREQSAFVDCFISTSQYYARHCVDHFGLPRDRVHAVPMGIRVEDFSAKPDSRAPQPFTIGYLARICPEKGLPQLCEAFSHLCQEGRDCVLKVAGYLAPSQQSLVDGLGDYLRQPATAGRFEFVGEVSRSGKMDFLHSLDVLSVPSVYHEAKGLYVLEALACGVPVVEPDYGSFPELIEATGGGILYDAKAGTRGLAAALARLMDQSEERRQMGERGRRAVLDRFNDRVMAQDIWKLYEQFAAGRR